MPEPNSKGRGRGDARSKKGGSIASQAVQALVPAGAYVNHTNAFESGSAKGGGNLQKTPTTSLRQKLSPNGRAASKTTGGSQASDRVMAFFDKVMHAGAAQRNAPDSNDLHLKGPPPQRVSDIQRQRTHRNSSSSTMQERNDDREPRKTGASVKSSSSASAPMSDENAKRDHHNHRAGGASSPKKTKKTRASASSPRRTTARKTVRRSRSPSSRGRSSRAGTRGSSEKKKKTTTTKKSTPKKTTRKSGKKSGGSSGGDENSALDSMFVNTHLEKGGNLPSGTAVSNAGPASVVPHNILSAQGSTFDPRNYDTVHFPSGGGSVPSADQPFALYNTPLTGPAHADFSKLPDGNTYVPPHRQ